MLFNLCFALQRLHRGTLLFVYVIGGMGALRTDRALRLLTLLRLYGTMHGISPNLVFR